MNDSPVAHPSEMDFLNWDLFIGDQVNLEFDRAGERETVQFIIEELTQ